MLGFVRGCVAACDLSVPLSFNRALANITQLGHFFHLLIYAGYYGTSHSDQKKAIKIIIRRAEIATPTEMLQ